MVYSASYNLRLVLSEADGPRVHHISSYNRRFDLDRWPVEHWSSRNGADPTQANETR